jgi:ABC-2 type transport system permease protein
MNTLVTELPAARPNPLRSYVLEARCEFLRVLRTPAFAIPSLLFPPLFYLLFGLLLNHGNAPAAHYLLATYGVFGTMGPALFGFGVGVAIERERGWLALKRVAPMPPGAYLMAKMVMAALFALIIYVMLAIMGATLGGVWLTAVQWLLLGAVSVFGVLPFCALGLLIGARANAAAAPAIVNFIYLPMAFLSGLWMPLSMLPPFIGHIAWLWPPYHLAQLALAAIGFEYSGTIAVHLLFLAAFTGLCWGIARRALTRAVAG